MSLRDLWRGEPRRSRDEREHYSQEPWQNARRDRGPDPWRNPWRDESGASRDEHWQTFARGSDYGGSSSNPFYGERPLTRAGSTFDSNYFGAHNYPSTPWRSEPSGPEFDELVYGGRREERESGLPPGQFRGRGPRGYRRSDERIKEDVCQYLTDDPHIDASEIEVAVSDREVVLSGSVQSRAEKRYAEDVIERLPGVRDVINGLRVTASNSPASQATSVTPDRQSGARR